MQTKLVVDKESTVLYNEIYNDAENFHQEYLYKLTDKLLANLADGMQISVTIWETDVQILIDDLEVYVPLLDMIKEFLGHGMDNTALRAVLTESIEIIDSVSA